MKSPLPLVAKIFDPLDFFPYIFSEIFSRTFLIFFQTFKNCPGLPKFFTGLPKIFPRPTKNVILTFHKFLQFCLSNSDVSTTFGHFSQKLLLWFLHPWLSATNGFYRNYQELGGGGGKIGKNNFGGISPPLPPPGAATVYEPIP